MQIGVLGAAGTIGRGIVQILSENGADVLVHGRKAEKLLQLFGECNAFVFDIFQTKELINFIKKSDLVISCIGPSYEIGDYIGRYCLQEKTAFMDLAGGEKLLEKYRSLYETKSDSFIGLDCGVYPGLTELFLKFAAKREKDKDIKTVEEVFFGNGKMSESAMQDIFYSMLDDESEGFSYVKNGLKTKVDKEVKREVKIQGVSKKVALIPIINESFRLLAEKQKLSEGYFYLGLSDMSKFAKLIQQKEQLINFGKLSDTEYQKDIFMDPSVEEGVWISVDISYNGSVCRYLLKGNCDWNMLTSAVAAYSALEIAEKNLSGVHRIYDVVSADFIIKQLSAKKLITVKKFQKG